MARASPIIPRAPAVHERTSSSWSCRAWMRGSTARVSPILPKACAVSERILSSRSRRAWMRDSTAGAPIFIRASAACKRTYHSGSPKA